MLSLLLACFCSSRGRGPGSTSPGGGSASGQVEVSGVDSTELSGRERGEWSTYVSELLAPCPDQPVSIADCANQQRACPACRPAAEFLLRQVSKGKARSQVEAGYRIRFSPEEVKKIDVTGSPVKGPPDAPITVVEWADFECPFCGNAAPLFDALLEKYPGSVRLIFKHYPLGMHKYAEKAARAAIAAGLQGKFWQMHRQLFESAPRLDDPALLGLAQKLSLDMARFQADMAGEKVTEVLARDRRQADALGLYSTPMIFINGRRFDLEQFKLTEDLDEWIQLELEMLGKKPVAASVPAATAPALAPRADGGS